MDTATSQLELGRAAGASIWDRHITMPVPQFLHAAGFGRTKLYDLLASGELESVVIGRRRLIMLDSYRKLIERQLIVTSANRAGALAPQRRNPRRFAAS